MLRLFCLTLFVSLICASPLLKATRMIEGIVSCGSAGTLSDLTLKDVDGTHECLRAPCDIYVGHIYDYEVDFRPSFSHKAINSSISVTFPDGSSHNYLTMTAPVMMGNMYTVAFPWNVTRSRGTGAATIRIEVGNNDVTELCLTVSGFIREE